MNTPRLLLGCAIIFWGYFSNVLLFSILMALLLEIQPIINWRRSTSDSNFYLIGDSCTAILIFIAVIAFFNNQQRLFIYQLVAWLPFAFYPLIITEFYSDRDKTPIGAFVYRYRKLDNFGEHEFSLGYLYFFLCLLSSSVTTNRTTWYFPIVLLLLAWALWGLKSKSVHSLRWVGIFLLSSGIAFMVELGLFKLSLIAENYSINLIDSLLESERDPYQMTTAMGRIGKLKLSSKILMQIQVKDSNVLTRGEPFLLQEAIYNVFYDNAWFNVQTTFNSILPVDAEKAWQISTPAIDTASSTLHIFQRRGKSRGLLPITASTSKITSDTDLLISRNLLGAIQFRANPELEDYRISIHHSSTVESKVSDGDLLVPVDQRSAILATNTKLNINTKSASEVIGTISEYFNSKFSYSTYQQQSYSARDALNNFLSFNRTGHCEYFASATVLLLRSAGIPARYSVGYSVQEFDPENNSYIVRARHRHAWAKAFVNGAWIDVDTTPSAWNLADQQASSFFEPIGDWLYQLQFDIRMWQKSSPNQADNSYYLLFVVIVLPLFFLKLKGKNLWKKSNHGKSSNQHLSLDTPCSGQIRLILDVFKQSGIHWQAHETLLTRAQRYEKTIQDPRLIQGLNEIIQLYYRIRFNGENLDTNLGHSLGHKLANSPTESRENNRNADLTTTPVHDTAIEQLQQKVDAWLAYYDKSKQTD